LIKELSLLQDELAKLKPAVESIELARKNVELVEKELPKATKKLSNIKAENKRISIEIQETVQTFEEISSDVKGKIDQIKASISDSLKKNEEKVETQLNNWERTFNEAQVKADEAIKTFTVQFEEKKESMTESVEELLNDVKKSSKEIFEIYDVLEGMKTAQQEYSSYMAKAEEILSQKLAATNERYTADLESQVEETLATLKGEIKQEVGQATEKVNDMIESVQKNQDQNQVKFNQLSTKYEHKVDELIERIHSRSEEINSIYTELESIRETDRGFKKALEASTEAGKNTLADFHKQFNSLKKSMESSELIANIEALGRKLDRLEKHAHKHNFGGIPI